MTALQNNPSAGGTNPYNPTQFVNQFGQYYQGQQYYPATSSSSIPQNDPNFLFNIGLGYPVNTMQMPRLQEQVVLQPKEKKSKKAKKAKKNWVHELLFYELHVNSTFPVFVFSTPS